VTVFRIRLLLLAGALALMGAAGDKGTTQIAASAKPIKAVNSTQPKPQRKAKIVAESGTLGASVTR